MLGWRSAMATALHDRDGFYLRAGGPAAHFRTSAHSPMFAVAIAALVERCGLRHVVDVGAGGGELLRALHGLDPGLGLLGIDRVARPTGLPEAVRWSSTVPDVSGSLVVANEWLDTVPVEIVQCTADGLRVVLVDDSLGEPVSAADLHWLTQWWPLRAVGSRAEVGRTRDDAWAGLVSRVSDSVLVAIDYAHTREARPAGGTLAAYRYGRQVRPVPDGTCDLTAHVALDACLAATGRPGVLCRQADAVAGLVPGPVGGWLERAAYADALAELTDPAGLGAFTWLVQGVGRPLPALRPALRAPWTAQHKTQQPGQPDLRRN